MGNPYNDSYRAGRSGDSFDHRIPKFAQLEVSDS